MAYAKRIDFSKIHWGALTKDYEKYMRAHPRSHIYSLEDFANYVLSHTSKFTPTTRRRAQFYFNILV
jgi:hypothetical protein